MQSLKKDDDYDTDSSEAEEVKKTIVFFKDKAAFIFEQLEQKKRFPIIVVIESGETENIARSSISESSLPRPLVVPRPPRISESTCIINSDDEDEIPSASGVA